MANESLSGHEQRELHRARYARLQAVAQGQTAQALPTPSQRDLPLPTDAILHTENLPGGWYWTTRIEPGEALRIANPSGTATVAMVAWSTGDPSERLNTADTIKLQWSAGLRKGRVLLTDMGRVAFSIIEDSSGAHDTLVGPSTAASMRAVLGAGDWRNGRDNFLAAAAKLGLSRRDVPACVSFFAPVGVDGGGRLVWNGARRQAGDFVDLRAEMQLWVVVSNAGHPLDPVPQDAPPPVTLTRFRAPAPAADDPCRAAGAEARRAFQFTERHNGRDTMATT